MTRPGYWEAPSVRRIVFIGYSVLWHPYRRMITSIYELTNNERVNYEFWYSLVREQNERIEVTTTDQLEVVLADERLHWTGQRCTGESFGAIL